LSPTTNNFGQKRFERSSLKPGLSVDQFVQLLRR